MKHFLILLLLITGLARAQSGPVLPTTCTVGDSFTWTISAPAVLFTCIITNGWIPALPSVPGVLIDDTVNNVTTEKHGLFPKLPGDTLTYFRADGTWQTPTASAAWGGITGTLSNQTDLQSALDGKLALAGNGSALTGLTKTQVGLANVDNTSDANKPVSTATQTALDGKLATTGNGSALTGLTKTQVGLANVENTALSTWAGSTNLTTLGTVGTGAWNATAIADGKIASALTGKTYNGLTLTSTTGTLTLTNAKTLSISNTLTFTGTDSSSVNFGAGGTVLYSGGALGTPSSGTLTSATGLPLSTGVTGTLAAAQFPALTGDVTTSAGSLATAIKTSVSLTTPIIGVATGTSLAATGAITSSGTAGIGYATGAGCAVTQLTNKSTATPACNMMSGEITMNGAALAAAAIVSFTLTNNVVGAKDVLILNHVTTGTRGGYLLNAQSSAGSAIIYVRNNTAGSLSEAIVIRFVVIKGVTS